MSSLFTYLETYNKNTNTKINISYSDRSIFGGTKQLKSNIINYILASPSVNFIHSLVF